MELILSRLPTCVSKDLADELALNFCFINTKINRRRLVRGLCDVPRAALQLVPFYARIAAVVGSVFPDVPAGLVAWLEAEFNSLVIRKDPTPLTLEPRLRNARYMAELAKFRLLPPGTFFSCLKRLLDDFSGHNVEAAATLVEAAGRFMARNPDTKTRMENMLEVRTNVRTYVLYDSQEGGMMGVRGVDVVCDYECTLLRVLSCHTSYMSCMHVPYGTVYGYDGDARAGDDARHTRVH